MNNEDNVIRASGLNRNSNDIVLPPGSLVAADECVINKDNVISRRRGFLKCATGLPVNKPEQLFTDGGKLYVHINGQIFFVNSGTCDYALLQGQNPLLTNPQGIFLSPDNILYFDDGDTVLRQINIAAAVSSTIAGKFGVIGTADGVGGIARFNHPESIWGNSTDLYICDQLSSTIRKYNIATNTVSTFAGLAGVTGSADGIGAAARFNFPYGITGDATDLWVTDEDNFTIRRVDIATATVSTFAGTALASGSADGIGAAARFFNPLGIWNNATDLYVADFTNCTIRKIVKATATVSTPAGTVLNQGFVDGPGNTAKFKQITDCFGDASNLYIPDRDNFVIRRMNLTTNVVDTVSGNWINVPGGKFGFPGNLDGTGTNGQYESPYRITGNSTDMYIIDLTTIRRLRLSDFSVMTYAGIPGVSGYYDGSLLNNIQGP